MTTILLRVRRWGLLGVLFVVAMALVIGVGTQEAGMPGADGPRVVRQYLVAGLPCLAATVLLDELSEISGALRREPRLRLIDQLLVTFGCYGVLVIAWFRSTQTWELHAYEWFAMSILLCLLLAGTARWGLTAILVASLAAMAWFFAGDTIALALGFGDLEPLPGMPSGLDPSAWLLLGSTAVALPVSFLVGLSVRWRG